jgi:hypothetical protein
MKGTILIIFLTLLFSCQEPCYECQSIGAEACSVIIKNNKAIFIGKDCASLKYIEHSSIDSLLMKVKQLGFDCKKK